MGLVIFECSECQNEQKCATSTPYPFGLTYKSECFNCKKNRVFNFVREKDMTNNWFSNILIKNKRRRKEDLLCKTKKRAEEVIQVDG